MNRILIIAGIIISVIIFFIVGGKIYTKSFSPEDQAMYVDGSAKIIVDYCRPSKKGRKVFGDLEPYGEIWRTGANEATQIELGQDFIINDQKINAGKYSLFTIPGHEEWVIIFNEQIGQWGTIYNENRDVLRVNVPTHVNSNLVETFTIEFEENNNIVYMILMWDDTIVKVPFQRVTS